MKKEKKLFLVIVSLIFIICIPLAIDIIKDETFSKMSYSIKPSVMEKYKNFDIVITVKYRDLFENEFSQKIVLSSNMRIEITKDGNASHLCDINLKETTVPIRTKERFGDSKKKEALLFD